MNRCTIFLLSLSQRLLAGEKSNGLGQTDRRLLLFLCQNQFWFDFESKTKWILYAQSSSIKETTFLWRQLEAGFIKEKLAFVQQ